MPRGFASAVQDMHDLEFLSVRDNPVCAGFYPALPRPVAPAAAGVNGDDVIADVLDALRGFREALPTLADLDAGAGLVRGRARTPANARTRVFCGWRGWHGAAL